MTSDTFGYQGIPLSCVLARRRDKPSSYSSSGATKGLAISQLISQHYQICRFEKSTDVDKRKLIALKDLPISVEPKSTLIQKLNKTMLK